MLIDDLHKLINEERNNPVEVDAKLNKAAWVQVLWMSEKRRLSHIGYRRSKPQNRVADTGFISKACGEVIARGQLTAKAVMFSWLNSTGHRRIIKDERYTHVGMAYIDGYWCAVFATKG